ncbi:MAG: flagellar basal body P-ring formation chaperone FlgA [Pseudomonadota bacterium]
MRRILAALVALGLAPVSAGAETVLAARTIRAHEVIAAADVTLVPGSVEGAASAIDEVEGLESRQILYRGQPIPRAQLGPPALVERNGLVVLRYSRGGMVIEAEGRTLDRGGVGDRVQAMNLGSRRRVEGRVTADGAVQVSGLD